VRTCMAEHLPRSTYAHGCVVCVCVCVCSAVNVHGVPAGLDRRILVRDPLLAPGLLCTSQYPIRPYPENTCRCAPRGEKKSLSVQTRIRRSHYYVRAYRFTVE